MREALLDIGYPVVQGALSTIVGVLPLLLPTSYIYQTFVKMMFLVIFLGLLHGFLVLPVVLSLVGPAPSGGDPKTSEYSSKSKSNSKYQTKNTVFSIETAL